MSAQPTRIPPVLLPDGTPADLTPPTSGNWLRDADGGLTPADADTAALAGLAWPAAPALPNAHKE